LCDVTARGTIAKPIFGTSAVLYNDEWLEGVLAALRATGKGSQTYAHIILRSAFFTL
jgi:hypothetical protein